jgi:hypothetical protein
MTAADKARVNRIWRTQSPPMSYEERVTKHLLAKGARAERQRIRRAQQRALANLKLVIPELSAYYEDILAIDRATHAPKGKRT